ncbi:UPF0175 family protein [candidate division KSB1 bacterium]|nr:UPF0175 family protein [candidate division KSB1 bacterium]
MDTHFKAPGGGQNETLQLSTTLTFLYDLSTLLKAKEHSIKRGALMPTAEVRFSIPADLVESIKTPADYGYQSFVLNLYLDEEISFGKAAKLLNMTYDEFLEFLGRRKLPYFRDTPDELSADLQELKSL